MLTAIHRLRTPPPLGGLHKVRNRGERPSMRYKMVEDHDFAPLSGGAGPRSLFRFSFLFLSLFV